MKSEVAGRGVQHHRDSEQTAEASLSQLEERFAGRPKQRVEDQLRERPGQRTQLARQREDDLEKPSAARFRPLQAGVGLRDYAVVTY